MQLLLLLENKEENKGPIISPLNIEENKEINDALSPNFYQKNLRRYENYEVYDTNVLKVTNSLMQKMQKMLPQKALALFDEMKSCLENMMKSLMSLATVLLSQLVKKQVIVRFALALLSKMKESGIKPDVISYSAAISACEKADDSKTALALLFEMKKKVE